MAFTQRSKRLGYDNISEGNAAGKELIIGGGSSGDGETTRLTLSQRGASTSALSQQLPELLIPGYTSGSSFTSNFTEIVG